MADVLEELFGDIDADGYVPTPCRGCGLDTRAVEWAARLCVNRCCTEWSCPGCGTRIGSVGPVGCRCPHGPNPLTARYLHRRRKARK